MYRCAVLVDDVCFNGTASLTALNGVRAHGFCALYLGEVVPSVVSEGGDRGVALAVPPLRGMHCCWVVLPGALYGRRLRFCRKPLYTRVFERARKHLIGRVRRRRRPSAGYELPRL